jgi:4-amino-4-deoxy-L-arabinose transferase-like glycosyltransferase
VRALPSLTPAIGAVRSARPIAMPSRPRDWGSAGLLAVVLLGGLGLRLWSIDHGLPLAYNLDEDRHFVERAIDVAAGDLNPHYFENPPVLTYLLAAVYRAGVPYGWTSVEGRFVTDPAPAFLTGRLVVALLAGLTLVVVYWAGRRLLDRRGGLVAATLLATAFLPVLYAKQAINDTVTLLPLTLGLVACLNAWERGRGRDWLLAGVAFGSATATKYTAGAAVVTVVLAAVYRLRQDGRLGVARNLALAVAAFVAAYLAVNPYALLNYDLLSRQLLNQAGTAAAVAKLGHDEVPAALYYLWTLTWGLGWAPLAAAAVGALAFFRAEWRRGLLVAAFPVGLFCYLAIQARFFGRWLLPAYPALVLFAGYAVTRLTDALRLPVRARPAVTAALTAILALQGVLASSHVGRVLGRTDTRQLAADWLDASLPRGTGMVIEPFTPEGYLADVRGGPGRFARRPVPEHWELYETTLTPGLVDEYRREGRCWVVVGSHQKDRGLRADLPGARAYYGRLRLQAARVITFSPYRTGASPVPFSFDFSYNHLPRAFQRPGPVVEIYQLADCSQPGTEGA